MKYYCIKQHDITDCGAACFATIAKQNGMACQAKVVVSAQRVSSYLLDKINLVD